MSLRNPKVPCYYLSRSYIILHFRLGIYRDFGEQNLCSFSSGLLSFVERVPVGRLLVSSPFPMGGRGLTEEFRGPGPYGSLR